MDFLILFLLLNLGIVQTNNAIGGEKDARAQEQQEQVD